MMELSEMVGANRVTFMNGPWNGCSARVIDGIIHVEVACLRNVEVTLGSYERRGIGDTYWWQGYYRYEDDG